MFRLVICAISIDDVRDIFGADAALAARLREVAARRFPPPARPEKRWFGPLLKRDHATEVDASAPLRPDVDALLAGAFVPPERLPQSWALLTAWIEELAATHRSVPWDAATFERIEWDLARAGLSSDYDLRSLADRPTGVSLKPLPGQVVGYAKHGHAVEALEHYREVLRDSGLGEDARDFVRPIMEVLETVAQDERLDVVVVGVVSAG